MRKLSRKGDQFAASRAAYRIRVFTLPTSPEHGFPTAYKLERIEKVFCFFALFKYLLLAV